jgi:hypothetical protein
MNKLISIEEIIEVFGDDYFIELQESILERILTSQAFKECADSIYLDASIYNFEDNGWGFIRCLIDSSDSPLIEFRIIEFNLYNNKDEATDSLLDFYNENKESGAKISLA